MTEATKSESWIAGYYAGKRGHTMSMVATPEDWGDFHVGYAVGRRDRHNDELIDEISAAMKEAGK